MNWGVKITIVFSLFVAGMLFMVFKSARQNMDLVVPDYYEQELKYQNVIDATIRTSALSDQVRCRQKNDSLLIVFSNEMNNNLVKAEVWLYCIADKKKDDKKIFTTSNALIGMPLKPANKGLHEVIVNWQMNGLTYYHKQKIFIQ